MLKVAGPRMELRPAPPHCPLTGVAKAALFRKYPFVDEYIGTFVRSGRIGPVIPVPGTAARYTGVWGRPVPAFTCANTVHSLNARPRQPLNSDPPPLPMPVVYCRITFSRCR